MTVSFKWELPFGAEVLDSGRTRFRIFAPAKEAVSVEIDGRGSFSMHKGSDGVFEAILACGSGARYRYRLADDLAVPDPASRAQLNDVHDWSLVVDPAAYRWQTPWHGRPWQNAVLYELHAGLFGGFRGVEKELRRLASLGVTAVELMPVNDFPGRRNWGYDGVLPYAPDSAYGSPDDLKALIDAAHACGLMIFLDVVYNHFGPDGNYLGSYAPQFFRNDLTTPWGPAIDFRRPEVRRFFTQNALYWLMEYRFDGLRFDAVHAISESDWLDEMARAVRDTVEPDRHVHLVLENEANQASHLRGDFDAQWNDDFHHALHVLLTGERDGYYEDYADDTAGKLARALSEGFIFQGEASRHREGGARGTPSGDLSPDAFVCFLQNHDQIGNRAFGERLTTLARPTALEAAIALQLLAPQIPLIFMGEEIASETPFLFFTDHHGALADAVREGRRREFAKFKGFADPARREKIPDPNDVETFRRSAPVPPDERGERRSELYRRLLAVRAAEIVPRLAGTRSAGASASGPQAVVARWRLGDGALLTIACNLAEGAVSLREPVYGRMLFESGQGAATQAGAGSLPPSTTVAFLETAP
ncbi:MAG: malto-oligosyltrehalose trehalohydrolase [Xanthobacteraceae bacterium]|nr:malto-oligosyltrehalose trehalohydrolase [Xanthobacteraceae bacterium]